MANFFQSTAFCKLFTQLYGLSDPEAIESGIARVSGGFVGAAVGAFLFYFTAVRLQVLIMYSTSITLFNNCTPLCLIPYYVSG